MTTAKLKLDTWHKNCVVVSASQGEVNARFLEITLVDGGEPLNLEGTTVLIYAEKPDKNVIFNNCTIENANKGIISAGLTSQMSALSGKLDCEIHVINREKSILKILGLQIRIMPCANSDSAVESTSEFTVLSDAIEQTLEIMDQYSEENIMGKIKSMDGAGSGLDADLLDGKHGNEYATKTQGTKADSAIQGVQGNGTTITPNASKIVNITPTNIGAVPSTRKVNSKPLSSDVTLTPSDIGAANEQHNHSADEINSGILPIERGGTNASTSTQALENLGGVPKTRTVNNKALSSDISLTASDVGAATTSQGTKADSAIQGVKVNGTLVTPDSSKTVNIDAISLGGATTKTYTASLSTTWTGSSAPYAQTVTVTGITSTDTPIVDAVLSSTKSTALKQLEAWGCVSKIETGTNQITATCLEEKPTTAIPIQLKVVR